MRMRTANNSNVSTRMDKWLEILQNKSAHIVNTKNFVSYIYDQLPNMDAPRLKPLWWIRPSAAQPMGTAISRCCSSTKGITCYLPIVR